MELKSKTLVGRPSQPGNVPYEYTFYTRPTGLEKIRIQVQEIKDDIVDAGLKSFSADNGGTWSNPEPAFRVEDRDGGILRQSGMTGFIDPGNGLLLNLILEGVLPADHALDGMTSYYLKYKVSGDGGHSSLVEDYVVQHGEPYSPSHPIEYVHVGRNSLMHGAEGSILRTSQGHLVVATMITPLGPDGKYYNPGGGYTYHEIVLLFGHWRRDGRIEWELGPRITIDPHLSTRGLIEPTMALMPDGRILLVMRGSNGGSKDRQCEISGRKWHCISNDGGHSWSEVQEWRYSDGQPFYSPSSISQLFRHSSGRYFWFGNICPENPKENHPRYPMVAVEVDPESLAPLKDSLFTVQDFDPALPPSQQYSNFVVSEDRVNGDLIVHMTATYQEDGAPAGNAFVYRLTI